MDPTAALRMIRELIAEADAISSELCHDDSDAHRLLYALTEAVEGLDRWLCRGGFLPVDWNHAITSEHALLIKERDDLADQNRDLLDQVQCLQWDLGALQTQLDRTPATRRRR
ncbi:hypothetical protein HLB23_39465 [Nocardia uniformis]|uniref:Uncharacterized protein n=1 Tax=Nocardia uniformis TaxID=53432 RepID=A0A849CGP1_9NOCA|nr:hypothetical protein [Nocardia uniformis]NNH75867.1 hypothetical protein [Nocardia uniformis]